MATKLASKKYVDDKFKQIFSEYENVIYNGKKDLVIDDYGNYCNMISHNDLPYYAPATIISLYPITFKPTNATTVIKASYLDNLFTESGYYIYTIKRVFDSTFRNGYIIDGYTCETIKS